MQSRARSSSLFVAVALLALGLSGCSSGEMSEPWPGAMTSVNPGATEGSDSTDGDAPSDDDEPTDDDEPADDDRDRESDESSGGDSTTARPTGSTGDEETGEPATSGGPGNGPPRLLVYISTEGGSIGPATADDAAGRVSSIVTSSVDVSPYVEAERAAEVLDAIEAKFEGLPVAFTMDDPGPGKPFTMVVLTTDSPTTFGFPNGVVGAASNDCGNVNDANIAIIFDTINQDLTVDQVANTAAYNLGVGLGLNITSTPGDAMNSDVQDFPVQFIDDCSEIARNNCDDVGSHSCPPETQNSRQALLDALE